MGGRYEWWQQNASSILAHSYGDLACYPNERGDVVLKQLDDMSEEDMIVVVPLDTAERTAAAILESAKIGREIRAGREQSDEPAPAPLALPAPSTKRPAREGELRLEGGTRLVRKSGGAT